MQNVWLTSDNFFVLTSHTWEKLFFLKTYLIPTFFCLQGCLCSEKASKDEHGEEDHGAAEAGGVQSPGQCARSDAPATPLLRTLPPSSPHDPEGAGRETLYDASCVQQGKFQLEWRKGCKPRSTLILSKLSRTKICFQKESSPVDFIYVTPLHNRNLACLDWTVSLSIKRPNYYFQISVGLLCTPDMLFSHLYVIKFFFQ